MSLDTKVISNIPLCWEIKKCGRENGGASVKELGECIASKKNLGHYCWIVAGTLCEGEIQGNIIEKRQTCMRCEVYRDYNQVTGNKKTEVSSEFPEETAKYREHLRDHYL